MSKYTKALLKPLVEESISIAQVLRKLGLKEAGGSHTHISRKIKEFGLDTSHFLGRAANCGKNHRGGPKKKTWQEILIKRTHGKRQHSFRLRRALIESGREYKCTCGLEGEWNGKPIMLQVDHKNKDWLDDRKENLEFNCPNCHSQTDGWCGSKGWAEITTIAKQQRERRKKQAEVAELVDA